MRSKQASDSAIALLPHPGRARCPNALWYRKFTPMPSCLLPPASHDEAGENGTRTAGECGKPDVPVNKRIGRRAFRTSLSSEAIS
jgi:hypothetical protein